MSKPQKPRTLEQIFDKMAEACGEPILGFYNEIADLIRAERIAAARVERERCLSVVAGLRCESNPIGPLFQAGWNEVVHHIDEDIRALPDDVSEEA